MKDVYRQKGKGKRKLYWAKKADWLLQSHFLYGLAEVYQADCLTVLIRQFLIDRFKIPFLAEPEYINFWFGDVRLSINSSLWGLLSWLFCLHIVSI